jgi:hypothetical protein
MSLKQGTETLEGRPACPATRYKLVTQNDRTRKNRFPN